MKILLTFTALIGVCFVANAQEPAAVGDVLEVQIGIDPKNPLAYDSTGFTVKAGAKVKLTFTHNSSVALTHNLLILVPGAEQEIAAAGMAMLADPKSMEKGFIPESEKILHHTKLLTLGQVEILEFEAPKEAGNYPIICTFPGHATTMKGLMKVE